MNTRISDEDLVALAICAREHDAQGRWPRVDDLARAVRSQGKTVSKDRAAKALREARRRHPDYSFERDFEALARYAGFKDTASAQHKLRQIESTAPTSLTRRELMAQASLFGVQVRPDETRDTLRKKLKKTTGYVTRTQFLDQVQIMAALENLTQEEEVKDQQNQANDN